MRYIPRLGELTPDEEPAAQDNTRCWEAVYWLHSWAEPKKKQRKTSNDPYSSRTEEKKQTTDNSLTFAPNQ